MRTRALVLKHVRAHARKVAIFFRIVFYIIFYSGFIIVFVCNEAFTHHSTSHSITILIKIPNGGTKRDTIYPRYSHSLGANFLFCFLFHNVAFYDPRRQYPRRREAMSFLPRIQMRLVG